MIGILDDRIFSIDRPKSEDELTVIMLRIRDLKTGQIMQEFPTLDRKYRTGRITPDGQWAVLNAGSESQTAVMSLKTGELRYEPILKTGSVSLISSDSRYCWIDDDLVDLSSGQDVRETGPVEEVSADSPEYLTLENINERWEVKICNIADGHVRLQSTIPIPNGVNARVLPGFQAWKGNRLYVIYDFEVPGKRLNDHVCWSYETGGSSLSAPRQEPQFYGSQLGSHVYRSILPWHANLEHDFVFGWEKGSFPYWLNDKLDSVGISLGRFGSDYLEYTWRSLSPETRKPVGPVIAPASHRVTLSRSQDWLVEYGAQLRAWKLPAVYTGRRCSETLLAGLSPWLLWWCFRAVTRRAARKTLTTTSFHTQCGGTSTEEMNHGRHGDPGEEVQR